MKINLDKTIMCPKVGDIIKDDAGKHFLVFYNSETKLYHLMRMPECTMLPKGEKEITTLIADYFTPAELSDIVIYASERIEINYIDRD